MKKTESEKKDDEPRRGKKKLLVDNLSVGDIYRLKQELNLSNKKMCELFDI